jgi:hypothetical protein
VPFTPSHIAAVVPLMSAGRLRRVLDPWALAVGAMIPDLPLFLPMPVAYRETHSLAGLVLYDLPAALMVLAVLQWVVRDPLTALLPPGSAGKVAALPGPAIRRLPALAAGAMVGAATHILWDSFTHSWSAEFWGWEWLSAPVAGWLTVHRVLQYASTVGGLAVVVWWCRRELLRLEPRPAPKRLLLGPALRRAVLLLIAAGGCVGALTWRHIDPPNPGHGWAAIITKAGIGTVVGSVAVLTVYVLAWHMGRTIRSPIKTAKPKPELETGGSPPDQG